MKIETKGLRLFFYQSLLFLMTKDKYGMGGTLKEHDRPDR